jgi:hypothetical protein
MTNIALPPHVQKRIDLDRRAEYWAALKRNFTIEDPRCQEWTRKLQHLSRDLFLVKANDKVEIGVPLRPGFFHLLIMPRDAPPLLTPLTNGDEFAEPGDWIFDVLNRGNLRERRVRETIEREQEAEQAAIEKERRTAKENRMERVRDIVNSATRAQVSMDRSIPWTQNSDGRRPK